MGTKTIAQLYQELARAKADGKERLAAQLQDEITRLEDIQERRQQGGKGKDKHSIGRVTPIPADDGGLFGWFHKS